MISRKGQGTRKGKQPAKKRPAPQVSPPQSSSDKESWPVWQKLQEKISALEAQREAWQAPQCCETQPRRSARETKGQRKAKLKAMAQYLMDRFIVLEYEQGPDIAAR